ncbi:MAG: protein kinase [Polyangiaceae bacterium]
MAVRTPRREAQPSQRLLPDFGSADDLRQTDIVPTPLRLLEEDESRYRTQPQPRYTLCGEFEYGGLPNVHLAFLEGAAGFRRTVVVQRLQPAGHGRAPLLSPDALLGCHTRHPNVIPVLDLIEERGEHLLVLEYVISTTLARLQWQGNRMPLSITSAILGGVLHALEAAHGARDGLDAPLEIVHGGVSPDNILVGVDGTARLIHFGLARRDLAAAAPVVRSKNGYVAPEQIFDQRSDVRSDVFSVGVLLWECLAGRPLLEGGSAVDTMLRFISRPAPPPSSFNPQVPAALDAAVARALEPTPARRFPSAAAFTAELEALIPPASREEVARYIEGVAWSSLHEQRLLLRGPGEEEESAVPISQLWDRAERAPSGPRASVDPDDPTLARNYFISPERLSELKSDWKARLPDEPTKVDGVRPATAPVAPALPPQPLAEANFESEPPPDFSPPPPARLAAPRAPQPFDAQYDDEIPHFRGNPERLARFLWLGFALALIAFVVALARTPYGRALGLEVRELASRIVSGKPVARPSAKAVASTLTPAPVTTPAAPTTRVEAPKPVAPTPSLRVLSLDELPTAEEAKSDPKAKDKRARKRR